eukprot:CAMPEP_0202968260 /NCGR_PEP_ID=MMETSP1396-20130829/13509_1 /ASSEMBLY_ACC=CAM_ASM_000872 /TAXON_ID= /ORGANISM="Pseudokeronopsis sp., Strain Brazil" /LENGTH=57 /DNA_ID=CAMNT_0049694391 /DNA_START=156 /DNA_END=329 /DNA_ORIENTATION=+
MATQGECKAPAPSRMKIFERAKWDAWKKLGSTMTKEEAKQKFVDFYCQKITNFTPKL